MAIVTIMRNFHSGSRRGRKWLSFSIYNRGGTSERTCMERGRLVILRLRLRLVGTSFTEEGGYLCVIAR
jgi:hypothetical protein